MAFIERRKEDLERSLYTYKARVISVYDGDTIRADLDLGLGIWVKNQKFRLAHINTLELTGTEGEELQKALDARDTLRELVLDKDILIQTIKDRKGKYGRFLCILWAVPENDDRGTFFNVNDHLVQKGLGESVEY
jgi:micrococcal nuclease